MIMKKAVIHDFFFLDIDLLREGIRKIEERYLGIYE
jgi:hypothetical protein